MQRPLIIIVPGLTSEKIPAATRIEFTGDGTGKVPTWTRQLAEKCLARFPDAVVFVCNYTRSDLAAWVANTAAGFQCDGVWFVGHSDGAACGVWIQDNAGRNNLKLVFDRMAFLDDVNDLVRHGILARIRTTVVKQALRIYQTADWIIHANPLYWTDNSPLTSVAVKDIPGANPTDNHGAMTGDVAVQDYVAAWLAS